MLSLRNVTKQYRTRNGRKTVLDSVDLTIGRSERVGILGRNGAGKSTLARIIGGSELPSSGKVERGMSVSWPLAFADGFQGSLTGLDNLRFICRTYAASYQSALPFVEAFTGLGHYLREPLKHYSSGMRARLAFAISMAIEFDCFLIDEVIAVGDVDFQAKCKRELFDRRGDRAMVIVSHDPHIILEHCSRACVLDAGKLHAFSDVPSAYAFYHDIGKQPAPLPRPRAGKPPEPASGPAPLSARGNPDMPPPVGTVTSPNFGSRMANDSSHERIIAACYRQLLGREADLDGLKHHAAELARRGDDPSAWEDTLRMFLAHPESVEFFNRRVLAGQAGADIASPHKIDNIVSLGTHCYTSAFLKRFHLKTFSSAFDWIFSSPSMVAHAIDDDFDTFLDSHHYQPVPIEERPDGPEVNRVQHRYYQQNHGVNFLFNHHDVNEEADYAYMTRCVERFRQCLRAGSRTLFVMARREDAGSQRDYRLVRDSLRRAAPDCRFVFVAIARTRSSTGVPVAEVLERDDSCAIYRFTGNSDWQTLAFADAFDEICLLRLLHHHVEESAA